MSFPVPSYSQYLDVPEEKWRGRSCGVIALKMLLDYSKNKTLTDSPTVQTIIRLGLSQKAYIPGIGWKHKGLVRIAHHFHFRAKNFDWANQSKKIALDKLFRLLDKQPIIASIYQDVKTKKGGHLVVLTGVDRPKEKLFMIDPAEKTRKKENRHLSIKTFMSCWKQRIIVIESSRLPKKKRIVRV